MLRIDWIYSQFQGYKSRECSIKIAQFLDFSGAKRIPIVELWNHFNKRMSGGIRPFPITFQRLEKLTKTPVRVPSSYWLVNYLLRNDIDRSMPGVYLFCDNGTEGYCVDDAWNEIVKKGENREQKSAYHQGEDEHYFKYFFSFCYNQIASGIELWDGPTGPRIDKGLYLSKIFAQYFDGKTKAYRKFLKDCLPGIEKGKEFLEEWITDNLLDLINNQTRPWTLGYIMYFEKCTGTTLTDVLLSEKVNNDFPNISKPSTTRQYYKDICKETPRFHMEKMAYIDEAIKLLKGNAKENGKKKKEEWLNKSS